MTSAARLLRSGWTSAAIVALAVLASVVLILSRTSAVSKPAPAASVTQPRTVVQFSDPRRSGAGEWRSHSAMNDLTPLFLPSDRNARLPALPVREPGDGTLDAQKARFTFREADAAVLANFPSSAAINGKQLTRATELDAFHADDSLSVGFGFGRRPAALAPRAPRGGLIEVYASGSGQLLLIEELAEDVHPLWPQVWQPLEFLAAVEPAGLVAPLSLTLTSRVDSVDAFFRDFIARKFKLGERMVPGFYRVVVSP